MTQPHEPVFTGTVANDSVLTWQKIADALALVKAIGPTPLIRESAFAPPGGFEIDGVLYVSPSVFRAMKGEQR